MELTKAIEILIVMNKEKVYLLTPDGEDAIKVGISAIEIVEEIKIRFPTLIPNLLLGKTPKIDNHRSLHHVKEVLRSPPGRGGG